MPYCKYCGAEHDADAAFCTECGKPIKPRKKQPPEPKPEDEKKPIPGFPEPADDSEREIFARMKQEKRRLWGKDEMQIGNTIFTVYNCVPENLTDEQLQESSCEKLKRLILNGVEQQQWEERMAKIQEERTT